MSVKDELIVAAMVAIMLVMHFDMANSKNYVVGNYASGYGWSVVSPSYYYPSGKTLHKDDTLQFIYNKDIHNVVGVGRMGYRMCYDGWGSKEFNTGNDTIKLINGMNYFICTKKITNPENQNMCEEYHMRIAVYAKTN